MILSKTMLIRVGDRSPGGAKPFPQGAIHEDWAGGLVIKMFEEG